MARLIAVIVLILLCLLAFLFYSNQGLRQMRDTLQDANSKLTRQIDWQNKTQRAVAAIDENRSRELTDAKSKIDDLQRDVADGRRRLRLSATCPTATAAAAGLADADGPRLTDAAQRDYYTLRSRIETAHSQIAGLQDYIRNVCLAQP
ncbi:lysis protein [Serratia plymuthica]|uniref:lysis protein n=1 Tax=Serratia plymuthica TaxID=82996 RepID=UPI002DBE7087|nr:lysis protein [Serratia plymuthica]MEB6537623.1 lysis protein [Serratia plymuthica]